MRWPLPGSWINNSSPALLFIHLLTGPGLAHAQSPEHLDPDKVGYLE
jgi:hypothetical protein